MKNDLDDFTGRFEDLMADASSYGFDVVVILSENDRLADKSHLVTLRKGGFYTTWGMVESARQQIAKDDMVDDD